MMEEKEKSSERPSHSSRGGRSSGGRGHRRVSSDVTGYSSLVSAELDDTLLEGDALRCRNTLQSYLIPLSFTSIIFNI